MYFVPTKMLEKFSNLKLEGVLFPRSVGDGYALGHEIAHMLYFWINNKKERLLQENYGFKTLTFNEPMTRIEALNEGKVIILQGLLVDDSIIDPTFVLLNVERKNISKSLDWVSGLVNKFMFGRITQKDEDKPEDCTPIFQDFYNEIKDLDLLTTTNEMLTWIAQNLKNNHPHVFLVRIPLTSSPKIVVFYDYAKNRESLILSVCNRDTLPIAQLAEPMVDTFYYEEDDIRYVGYVSSIFSKLEKYIKTNNPTGNRIIDGTLGGYNNFDIENVYKKKPVNV